MILILLHLVLIGILYYLSSTLNPLLYTILSVKYRESFKKVILCRNSRYIDVVSGLLLKCTMHLVILLLASCFCINYSIWCCNLLVYSYFFVSWLNCAPEIYLHSSLNVFRGIQKHFCLSLNCQDIALLHLSCSLSLKMKNSLCFLQCFYGAGVRETRGDTRASTPAPGPWRPKSVEWTYQQKVSGIFEK